MRFNSAFKGLISVSKRISKVRKCWPDCRFGDKKFQMKHNCLMYKLCTAVFSVVGTEPAAFYVGP